MGLLSMVAMLAYLLLVLRGHRLHSRWLNDTLARRHPEKTRSAPAPEDDNLPPENRITPPRGPWG